MKKTIIAAAACAVITSSAMANALDPNNPSGTVVDRFADIEVLRYTVPGFEKTMHKICFAFMQAPPIHLYQF